MLTKEQMLEIARGNVTPLARGAAWRDPQQAFLDCSEAPIRSGGRHAVLQSRSAAA
jgi:hypothetical protein